MKQYKVTYLLNENVHWTQVCALSAKQAAKNVYESISKLYPDEEYEYVNVLELDEPIESEEFIVDGNEYCLCDEVACNKPVVCARDINNNCLCFFMLDDEGLVECGPFATLEGAKSYLDLVGDMSITEDLENSTDTVEYGPELGMAGIINELIVDEYDAIDAYNNAIAAANEEGYEDVAKVFLDIQSEEQVHVGQLQKVMELFDPNADKVAEGDKEATQQLEDNGGNLNDAE